MEKNIVSLEEEDSFNKKVRRDELVQNVMTMNRSIYTKYWTKKNMTYGKPFYWEILKQFLDLAGWMGKSLIQCLMKVLLQTLHNQQHMTI